jgi:hypothetical protein
MTTITEDQPNINQHSETDLKTTEIEKGLTHLNWHSTQKTLKIKCDNSNCSCAYEIS